LNKIIVKCSKKVNDDNNLNPEGIIIILSLLGECSCVATKRLIFHIFEDLNQEFACCPLDRQGIHGSFGRTLHGLFILEANMFPI
jgi:hypothetical protein